MSIDEERPLTMLTTYTLYDFDGTLIHGESIIYFMRYALKNKLCSVHDVFRFAAAGGLFSIGLLSPKRAKEIALHFLKGKNRASFVKASEDFCRRELIPRLYPQAAETLHKHKSAGDTLVLVSASPTFYLEPLKEMLGFTAVLGTDMETDSEGRFTGKIVGLNCRGEEKPKRLKTYMDEAGAQMDIERSSAYGNSPQDIPMLKMCKNAYAVNPGKKMLKMLGAIGCGTTVRWKRRYQVCG